MAIVQKCLPAELVSIVIASHNGRCWFPGLFRHLAQIDYPFIEIIIVDDGSVDGSFELLSEGNVREWMQNRNLVFNSDEAIFEGVFSVRVVQGTGDGPSVARNIGIEHAKGSFIAFTDDDCLVASDWISRLMEGMESPDVVGCGGGQESPLEESSFGRLVQDLLKGIGFVGDYHHDARNGTIQVAHNPTCNVLYRKSALQEVGGFCSLLWPGEDVDLDRRLTMDGWKLMYNPQSMVAHYRPKTWSALVKMMNSYGRSQAYLMILHGPFRFLHIAPFIVLIGFLCWLCCLTVIPIISLVILLIFFIIILLYFAIKTSNILRGIRLLGTFSVAVLVWHFGFFLGLFTGKRFLEYRKGVACNESKNSDR